MRVHRHGKGLTVSSPQVDNGVHQEPLLPELLLEPRPFGTAHVELPELPAEHVLRLLEAENPGPGPVQGRNLPFTADSTDDILHVVEQVTIVLFRGPQAVFQELSHRDIGDVCECSGTLPFCVDPGSPPYQAGNLGAVPPHHLDFIASQLTFQATLDLLREDLGVGRIEQIKCGGAHELGNAIPQEPGQLLIDKQDAALRVKHPEAVVHRFDQASVVGLRLGQFPAFCLNLFLEFLYLLPPRFRLSPFPVFPDTQEAERIRAFRRPEKAKPHNAGQPRALHVPQAKA